MRYVKTTALPVLLALALPLSVGCSAESADDAEGLGESEDELVGVGPELVRTDIAINRANVDVQVKASDPKYTLLKFEVVEAPALLRADVIARNDADPIAYVLNASFRTLARNDDRGFGTTSSLVTYRVTRPGTYYIAIRAKKRMDANYRVHLTDGTVLRPKDWMMNWGYHDVVTFSVDAPDAVGNYATFPIASLEDCTLNVPVPTYLPRRVPDMRCTVDVRTKKFSCSGAYNASGDVDFERGTFRAEVISPVAAHPRHGAREARYLSIQGSLEPGKFLKVKLFDALAASRPENGGGNTCSREDTSFQGWGSPAR